MQGERCVNDVQTGLQLSISGIKSAQPTFIFGENSISFTKEKSSFTETINNNSAS